jgi:Na+-translocating ferredoxin:NAD+ oxidoreductase RnfG subunit
MKTIYKTLAALIIVASLSLNVYYVVNQPTTEQISQQVIKTLVKKQILNATINQLNELNALEQEYNAAEDKALTESGA